jgi:hypothetical protein
MHVTAVLIGNTAACVAAVAAAIGLYFARVTVREAKLARLDSEAARMDAVAERREAEQDRLRHRLERIGELLQDAERMLVLDVRSIRQGMQIPPSGASWLGKQKLLRHALVGLDGELPQCAAIINASTAELALAAMPDASSELESAVQRIHNDGTGDG